MAHHWFKIFEAEQNANDYLPFGTLITFQFKGQNICVTRTPEGFFAFGDKCPHNGASLSKGFCTKKNEIVCPLHRYSFDLSSGKATSGGAFALKTYPVEVRENGVYVGIKAAWWES
jgi:nitrite reductase/ring-hydroxylating ferredoxin subunit